MTGYKTRLFFSILFLLFAAVVPQQLFSVDFQEITNSFTGKIKTVRFANGLRLIMMKRENSPTAALYIKFRVGAVDESGEMAGTAHLLEHMLFKGTPNVGTRDFRREKKYHDQIRVWGRVLDGYRLEARDLEKSGRPVPEETKRKIRLFQERLALLQKQQNDFIIKNEDSWIYDQNGQSGFNAYTNQDVTNYQIELPVNRMEVWARLESDRLKHPVLREFYTERDVVIEERRMRVDNSGSRVLLERFLETAFAEHPYRKPVIGFSSVIPWLDQKQTEDFFAEHYTPDNMVISVVGMIDFEKTEKLIGKYFGDLRPGSNNKRLRRTERFHEGHKTVSVSSDDGPVLVMGWKKPAVPHRDNAAFEILSSVLSDGISSRLYSRLVTKEKLAINVSAWNGYPGERYDNLFMVYVTMNAAASHDRVEEIIKEEIAKIIREGISEKALQQVKKKAIADFFRGMNKNSELADYLSYYEVITGDWKNLFRLYSEMEGVSPETLVAVMKKYLVDDNLTTGRLVK